AEPQADPAKATPVKTWPFLLTTVLVMAALNLIRSATQVKEMWNVGTGGQTAGWVAGAKWDPGSFRINQRVAELYANRRQCSKARPHIRGAVDLVPTRTTPRA